MVAAAAAVTVDRSLTVEGEGGLVKDDSQRYEGSLSGGEGTEIEIYIIAHVTKMMRGKNAFVVM